MVCFFTSRKTKKSKKKRNKNIVVEDIASSEEIDGDASNSNPAEVDEISKKFDTIAALDSDGSDFEDTRNFIDQYFFYPSVRPSVS